MCECLCVPAQMVIDGEATTHLRHFGEVLHEWEVFPGVFLGLLGYEESEGKIVQAESVIIELVDVGEEANVFDCFVGHCFVGFH